MVGVEANELSAQFFIEYNGKGGGLKTLRSDQKGGGQYLRFRKGTQQVAHGLAGLLSPDTIQLSTPVTAITDTRSSVIVTSQSGKCYTGRKLILSIPTPLYKDLVFSPPLSGDKLVFASGTQHGYYSKMILCYASPWWTKDNRCGLAISYQTPVCVIRDTSVAADDHYCLTCFIGGEPGRVWSRLPQHERRSQVLKQVSRIYREDVEVFKPIEIFEQEWSKEEWSKGAPCPVAGPGLLTKAGAALKQSYGNLHFVGTETSDVWSGYMEGAVRSGIRGAKEVVESLAVERLSAKL
ncbi:Amine oxidase [flavin-containing] B [Lachnellula suecica]|uniref:Amine oxidase n=1 Tax=Lachnellula suecica TaxID=602035 RepID=A0A8T9BZ92_9HELO|nr:Amine oxidase [flavin-containing] B [Lachnellula suecica]